jgi:hypothetical protein
MYGDEIPTLHLQDCQTCSTERWHPLTLTDIQSTRRRPPNRKFALQAISKRDFHDFVRFRVIQRNGLDANTL